MEPAMNTLEADVKALMGQVKVLIVDDEHYTRKVIRTLLLAIGCTKIYEAGDGAVGLEMIRAVAPDVVLVDWECRASTAPSSCARCARPRPSRTRPCRSSC